MARWQTGRIGVLAGALFVLTASALAQTSNAATRDRELRSRMQQTYGGSFAVSFEGPAAEPLADKAVASLNRAMDRICAVLNTYPVHTIPVVLYTTEQFRDITRAPAWAAGAYDGTIRVPMRGALDNEQELDRVLAHEFTHALVHTLSPRPIPMWLDEGLAAALESSDPAWAERRVAQSAPVPLSLLQRSFGRFTGAQAQLAYATSAVAVRRMIDTAGGFAVANLIRDLGDGVEFDAAFAHRIERTFEEFQTAP